MFLEASGEGDGRHQMNSWQEGDGLRSTRRGKTQTTELGYCVKETEDVEARTGATLAEPITVTAVKTTKYRSCTL